MSSYDAQFMNDFENEILAAATLDADIDRPIRLENGCKNLQLLAQDENLIRLTDCKPWTRGGAESFVASGVLAVRTGNGREIERQIILKAYVGFGYSPEKRVETWRERSEVLASHGIPVSRVYSVSKGVLFTQFIKWSLLEFLELTSVDSATWASNLGRVVDALDDLRVHPVSLLPDLRTDGSVIYIVDFGEDLGEIPGTEEENGFCRFLVHNELVRYGFEDLATLL
ncbi:MAG: hypothetical protein ACMG6H_04310 [Acidobacteriota bacterium]